MKQRLRQLVQNGSAAEILVAAFYWLISAAVLAYLMLGIFGF